MMMREAAPWLRLWLLCALVALAGGRKQKRAAQRRSSAGAQQKFVQPEIGAPRDSPPKGWVKEWSHPFKGIPPSSAFPLTTVIDDALPQPLLEKLHGEASRFWEHHRSRTFANSKKATIWLGKDHTDAHAPRFFIEEAVAALASLIDVTKFGLDSEVKLAGGEWWVQQMGDTESIGFHYDKDEAMASDHWQMSYPVLSTITYLDQIGAPTLILNQTTPHGNGEDPVIPEYGTLVYPKLGRHVIFRGDLQHGTVAALTKEREPGRQRLTLLINWWTYAPLKPNTDDMTDELARDYGLFYPKDVQAWMSEHTEVVMKGGRVVQRIDGCELRRSQAASEYGADTMHLSGCQTKQTQSIAYPPVDDQVGLYGIAGLDLSDPAADLQLPAAPQSDSQDGAMTKVMLPPGEGLFFQTPPMAQIKSDGIYQFHWNATQVFGHVAELEPTNQLLWSVLKNDRRPKVVVFSPPNDLARVQNFVLPVARALTGQLKFAIADGSDADWAGVMKSFGLDTAVAKREAVAVITDTQGPGAHKAACQHAGSNLDASALLVFAREQMAVLQRHRHNAEL